MLSFFAWGGMQAQVPRMRAGMPVLVPGDGNSILHTSCAHDVGRMIARVVQGGKPRSARATPAGMTAP